MAAVHELSRADARRIAVRAQLLTKERPTDLVETVRQLSLVQLEPTSAIAPSAELVLWSRLGPRFDPQEMWDAVDEQRLIELHQTLRAADDIALFRAEMAEWPGSGPLRPWQLEARDWVRANNDCRREVLERLRADGPLPAGELPDTCVVPWRSSGWNDNRNLRMMLDRLVERGEIAAAGGSGRDRLWDLASRIYPDEPVPPVEEARRLRAERRLRSLGIARAKCTKLPLEPVDVGEVGEPAVVEGVRGQWRVDPDQLDGLGQPFAGRAALLSPFDRLLADRKRLDELFEFDYVLEMYKPAGQRVWGYYALPILYGDRLVGKLDARADRVAGVLRVAAVHRDVPFGKAMEAAVVREIGDLARWLDLELELPC
ncbi:DNA glycosylase AlkZ-like family protein [Nocardioides ungokensis]|uniref:DNA glycosylase AlkZ-like family protein n=1 Tax=Nocardioides ungokensis TaxID=1643322 RepID=UPI0015DF6EE6|nr:crosslink repair DNA glycosylase YcaQ family protein [Nocardioides ungokensis]